MCGIVGYWSRSAPATKSLAARMAARIAHRGPDGSGVWIDEKRELALAHRRLSIIDLSAAGHQPMVSPCGRYVLSYNGEIYNHLDVRRELDRAGGGFDWAGHSDTETLLAALRHWGAKGALMRLNGMFAFALWDNRERSLLLARDRLGEKPLYYGRCGQTFFFGSELKAFAPHPDWMPQVDRHSVSSFLRYGYVPGPDSVFLDIHKLPPASFLVITDGGRSVAEPVCYWDINEVAREGTASRQGSAEELLSQLDSLMRDAVKTRMSADVPLGAFLSGGYDSTAIVALMQAQSSKKVRTFTIGFHEREFNEADHARAIAGHLGTDHTEIYVSPGDALNVIPRLPEIWDEPFADSSQIPTLLLSELTRNHVTVSLSGDGGDELFCGYNRYALGYSTWRKLKVAPLPIRRLLNHVAQKAPTHGLTRLGNALPGRLRQAHLGDRLLKLGEAIATKDDREYYGRLVSHWKNPTAIVIGAGEARREPWEDGWNALDGMLDRMMLADTKTYLPDDIMVKVDRASMAASLESRAPMLDHRIVEFAWRMPTNLKLRGGVTKWMLRQMLYKYVPRSLMERPKMGFGVPIDRWLVGPLREWAEELLDERRLRDDGILNPSMIRHAWEQHCSGRRRWHFLLWDVLMFQAWSEAQKAATHAT